MSGDLLSYSRIRAYTGCCYKYDKVYNHNMSPRVDSRTPTLGSAGHVGMAAGILGDSIDEAIDKWGKKYIEKHPLNGIDEDVDTIIDNMVMEVQQTASLIVPRALEALNLDDWETIEYRGAKLVESKFIIPINDQWKGYTAVTDWVARHKPTNMTWLIDHKFRKVLQADEVEEYNLQMASYQYVLMTMGIQTVGSMANQILGKLPSLPSVNKDGSMSRAKISSTWEVYKGALLSRGLNPEDYLEMKDKLTTEFFRHSYSYRNIVEITNTWNDVILNASDAIVNDKHFLRDLGSLSCRNCWLADYCMEELRGGDLEYLLESVYMKRPDRVDNDEQVIMLEEEGEEE